MTRKNVIRIVFQNSDRKSLIPLIHMRPQVSSCRDGSALRYIKYYITQIKRENGAAENEQYPGVPFPNKTLCRISNESSIILPLSNPLTVNNKILIFPQIFLYIKTSITAGRRRIVKRDFNRNASPV